MPIDGHLIYDVVAAVDAAETESRCILLSGAKGAGKSHLLQHLACSERLHTLMSKRDQRVHTLRSVVDLSRVASLSSAGLVLIDNFEVMATSLEALGNTNGMLTVLRNLAAARCVCVIAVQVSHVYREIAQVWAQPVIIKMSSGVLPSPASRAGAESAEHAQLVPRLNPDDARRAAGMFGLKETLDTVIRHAMAACNVGRQSGRVAAGMRHSSGLLLAGGHGTGKSLTVALLAACLPQVPVMVVKAPHLFGMYLGETEERLRRAFAAARARRPAVLVLEGIEHIGRTRAGVESTASSTLARRVLAALLCEMDGVEDNASLFLIATTTAPGSLDPALLRQGRLETVLELSPLREAGACELLEGRFEGLSQEGARGVAAGLAGFAVASVGQLQRATASISKDAASDAAVVEAAKRLSTCCV